MPYGNTGFSGAFCMAERLDILPAQALLHRTRYIQFSFR